MKERQRRKERKEIFLRQGVCTHNEQFYLHFCPLVSNDSWHSSEGGELVGCHF